MLDSSSADFCFRYLQNCKPFCWESLCHIKNFERKNGYAFLNLSKIFLGEKKLSQHLSILISYLAVSINFKE